MRNIKNYENQDIYCPWNNRIGICFKCMALIPMNEEKTEFECGRLYPPTKFQPASG